MSPAPGKLVTLAREAFPPTTPPEKRDAKLRSARGWWVGAGVFMLVALLFIVGGFFIAATRELTLTLAVFLGAFVLVPLMGALFCANKASGEATAAFIQAVKQLARVGRIAVKGGNGNGHTGESPAQ